MLTKLYSKHFVTTLTVKVIYKREVYLILLILAIFTYKSPLATTHSLMLSKLCWEDTQRKNRGKLTEPCFLMQFLPDFKLQSKIVHSEFLNS